MAHTTLVLEIDSPNSINNVENGFWFYHDGIKHFVSENKNEYVMDWPIVPNTWLMKIRFNIWREKVSVLEYTMLQLQQREFFYLVVSFHHLGHSLSLDYIFCVLLNHDAHPTSKFQTQCIQIQQHQQQITKTKWDTNGRMDKYYAIGIPYPKFGMVINITFKKDDSYL